MASKVGVKIKKELELDVVGIIFVLIGVFVVCGAIVSEYDKTGIISGCLLIASGFFLSRKLLKEIFFEKRSETILHIGGEKESKEG